MVIITSFNPLLSLRSVGVVPDTALTLTTFNPLLSLSWNNSRLIFEVNNSFQSSSEFKVDEKELFDYLNELFQSSSEFKLNTLVIPVNFDTYDFQSSSEFKLKVYILVFILITYLSILF